MDIIRKYFPELTAKQLSQLEQLLPLYKEWNEKINIISRKDIDQLYLHHVLHSLSIAKFIKFKPGTKVIDLGTGGGFPGIPLAIYFPETQFTLCDSIAKKILVVTEVSKNLGLTNVIPANKRAEELTEKFDFVICRAVTDLNHLVRWTQKLMSGNEFNSRPNGLIALKGGDITPEIEDTKRKTEVFPLREFFTEAFFEEKYIIYVPL